MWRGERTRCVRGGYLDAWGARQGMCEGTWEAGQGGAAHVDLAGGSALWIGLPTFLRRSSQSLAAVLQRHRQ